MKQKNYFLIIIYMSMLCKSTVQDYWSLQPVIQIPYAASIKMPWDRFLKLLTMMQRQLGASQTMTHYSQFGQLLTHIHHKIS